MKILIIEDQPAELKLANLVLSEDGHDVSEAGDAQQAFDSIQANRPQLILLDLNLPGVDGLAFVRKLKTEASMRGIYVVAVTSSHERFPKADALAAGCDAYLPKPINTRGLSLQLNAVACGGDAANKQTNERPNR